MSNVAINVSTDILRKIIEEQPEISLKLATMAHEKIAEEIIRKVKNTSLDEIQDRVNSNVSRAISTATDIYKNQWKFPEEAKTEVRKLAESYVHSYGVNHQNEIRARLDKEIAARIEAAAESLRTRMEASIRSIAREEFIKVMQEVKSSI